MATGPAEHFWKLIRSPPVTWC